MKAAYLRDVEKRLLDGEIVTLHGSMGRRIVAAEPAGGWSKWSVLFADGYRMFLDEYTLVEVVA